tara:strand:- start:1279 stop:1725 length:447 start_codon:yes stop_codon:yes gene_type:complete
MILNSYNMSDINETYIQLETSVGDACVKLNKEHENLIQFLQHCGIACSKYTDLDDLVIPRDILVCNNKYDSLQEYVVLFKKHFSSSYLTSLQNTAGNKQRWPVLNFVRQILKAYNFKLTPKRLCDGYTKEKKKKYKRVFVIEKLKQIA